MSEIKVTNDRDPSSLLNHPFKITGNLIDNFGLLNDHITTAHKEEDVSLKNIPLTPHCSNDQRNITENTINSINNFSDIKPKLNLFKSTNVKDLPVKDAPSVKNLFVTKIAVKKKFKTSTPWTEEHDKILTKWISTYGIPRCNEKKVIVPGKTGAECKGRWNELIKNYKQSCWSFKEDFILFNLYFKVGPRWAKFKSIFGGLRTRNDIKNRFYSVNRRFMTYSKKVDGSAPMTSDEREREIYKNVLKGYIIYSKLTSKNDLTLHEEKLGLNKYPCINKEKESTIVEEVFQELQECNFNIDLNQQCSFLKRKKKSTKVKETLFDLAEPVKNDFNYFSQQTPVSIVEKVSSSVIKTDVVGNNLFMNLVEQDKGKQEKFMEKERALKNKNELFGILDNLESRIGNFSQFQRLASLSSIVGNTDLFKSNFRELTLLDILKDLVEFNHLLEVKTNKNY